MRALVVDDSKAMRLILAKMLKEVGFDEVYEAEHGREALELLDQIDNVELMLVDWNMPEMDGFDFVCAVRSDNTYDNVLVMMVTTETEMSQVVKALEAGVNEYVMKPFTKEVILEKLSLLGIVRS